MIQRECFPDWWFNKGWKKYKKKLNKTHPPHYHITVPKSHNFFFSIYSSQVIFTGVHVQLRSQKKICIRIRSLIKRFKRKEIFPFSLCHSSFSEQKTKLIKSYKPSDLQHRSAMIYIFSYSRFYGQLNVTFPFPY